ncbi:MAG: hypothetical protein M3P16_07435 [Chloroflexota bacterium]|nr:hypothetical protein [Chloroflexota bacterium]
MIVGPEADEPVDAKRFARGHARAHAHARRDRFDAAYPHQDHAAIVADQRALSVDRR